MVYASIARSGSTTGPSRSRPRRAKTARRSSAFIVRDLPWTVAKLKAIPPFEFENWAVIALGGIPNKVQVGDMGIDGRIFPVGTKPYDATTKQGETASMFAGDWFPIQVKQENRTDHQAHQRAGNPRRAACAEDVRGMVARE